MSGVWREYKRCGEVHAERLTAPVEWTVSSGATLRAEPGDWRVWEGDPLAFWTVKDSSFRNTYEQINCDRYRRVGTVQVRESVPGRKLRTQEGIDVEVEGYYIVRDNSGAEWQVSPARLATTVRRAE